MNLIYVILFTEAVQIIATKNVTIFTVNDIRDDTTIEIEGEDEEFHVYDEADTLWIREAIVNVGYYLRSHKFNEWDRRFHENKPAESNLNLHKSFPDPPLKYFHWEVFNHCRFDFVTCLRYLYEISLDASLQRSIDTIYVAKDKNLDEQRDIQQIMKINQACEEFKKLNEDEVQPFKSASERFLWRATASYYMCMFTIQETVNLRHFNETCNNWANCLQKNNKTSNYDVRANDEVPFGCAMYSFCPDPCCPNMKILKNWDDCWFDTESGNPCTGLIDTKCRLNKTRNLSFPSLVYNEWNVSCSCPQNLFWQSRYQTCIDYNICHREHSCNAGTETCVNSDDHSLCSCKFGFERKSMGDVCNKDELLSMALKSLIDIYNGNKTDRSFGNAFSSSFIPSCFFSIIIALV